MIRYASDFAREHAQPDRSVRNSHFRDLFERQAIPHLGQQTTRITQTGDVGKRTMPGQRLDFLLEASVPDSNFDLEIADSLIVERNNEAGGASCGAKNPTYTGVAVADLDDRLCKPECLGQRFV